MPQIEVEYELERDDISWRMFTRVRRPASVMQELAEWVDEHCNGRIIVGQSSIYFELVEEAVFFKLAYNKTDG